MKWRRRRFQRLRKKARQQQAISHLFGVRIMSFSNEMGIELHQLLESDKTIGQMVDGLKRRFKPLFDHVERIKQETKP